MLRRTFVSRFSAAAALLGAPLADTQPAAAPQRTASLRHADDDWFDDAPEGHRAVFDSWMADKFGEAFGFAANWLRYNKEGYGLKDSDLAVVLIARHGTMPFALNEAMWTKYGSIFAANMSSTNKALHPNPTANRYAARLAAMSSQNLRLAVCGVTLSAYVDIIGKANGVEPDVVRKELSANIIGGGRVVPAGVIAVTRAQERGYALVSVG